MTTEVSDEAAVWDADHWLRTQAPPPRREFDFLRAFLWVVPLMLLAGSVTYVFGELQPARYETGARVVLAAAPASDGDDYVVVDSVSALANRQFLGTYADIVDSAAVATAALADARIAAGDLADYEIGNAVSPESSSVDIRVSGPDAERTATVAGNVAAEAATRFEEFYPIFTVQVLDPPAAPEQPAGPQPLRMALIVSVLVIGLWLLVIMAFGTNGRS